MLRDIVIRISRRPAACASPCPPRCSLSSWRAGPICSRASPRGALCRRRRRHPLPPRPGSEAELEILLEGLTPVGYGPAPEGVRIRREGRGAVFVLPGALELALAPPEGHRLAERFVVLGPRSGGFILVGPEGTLTYLSFAHAGRPMVPDDASAAGPVYADLAERIREEGRLPLLTERLPVERVRADAQGVVYCLIGRDGRRYQGASRFVGPVALTAMRVGPCDAGRGEVLSRLDLGAAALSGGG